jgi:hypothetical protein
MCVRVGVPGCGVTLGVIYTSLDQTFPCMCSCQLSLWWLELLLPSLGDSSRLPQLDCCICVCCLLQGVWLQHDFQCCCYKSVSCLWAWHAGKMCCSDVRYRNPQQQ